jgi:ClpP class serine protease
VETFTPKNTAISAYIAPLLSLGYLSIDEAYLQAAYDQFMVEMAMLQSGAKWSELGLSERREAQRPVFLSLDGDMSMGSASRLPIPNSVALVSIKGVMRSMSSPSTRGADEIAQDVLMADANPNVEAIVFDVESGGGDSMAGKKLHSVIKGVKKPTLAMVDMAGSAALNTVVAANEVWAKHHAAEIGGIGTYVMFSKKMLEQMSTDLAFIYSEGSEGKNAAMRALLAGDTSLIQQEVNKSAEQFRENVRTSRELRGDVEKTLSGAMFDAKEARRRGLIDGIGNFNEIMGRVQTLVRRRKMK